jgi:pyridoxine 5'-phosphate synthase PdxJ
MLALSGYPVISISQFTVAVYALAQLAFAYSLFAQVGIYIHAGHGQLVKSLSELMGML